MKFFFPNSNDAIDPSFDFQKETRSQWRSPVRDDLYPHEVFPTPPYDGVLVSKSIVDGVGNTGGKLTLAQKHRIYRSGVRKYFRLEGTSLMTMGDCGAFSYVNEVDPPVSVPEVVEFYGACGFDFGLSVDHVILGYKPEFDNTFPEISPVPENWVYRREKTIALAEDFYIQSKQSSYTFEPVGVAQGWSPHSYADSVAKLQDIGYANIAIGGLVPLKTKEIIEILFSVREILQSGVGVHLLGVTRLDSINSFKDFGVTSFDSTSPFKQAFLDRKNNYHSPNRTYRAIRIPQVDKNPKLGQMIRAGEIDSNIAFEAEKNCLDTLREYGRRKVSIEIALEALREYEKIHSPATSQIEYYEESLLDRPWEDCSCAICENIGVDVIIFRGAERNKRRGFHNLVNFYQNLRQMLTN